MKVCCFGELLLRFSPEADGQWIKQNSIPVYVGGAELNVANALALWSVPVKYCTALPDHSISKQIVEELESKQIDTSAISFSGKRVGLYYLPQGADLKNEGVIYDRADSSFSAIELGSIDWDLVLDGCDWFHFSAISPALNKNAAQVCEEALKAAKAKGLTVSVDLNYRSKLWKYGVSPVVVMSELVKYCDVVMGNIWSAEALLGITASINNSDGKEKVELIAAASESIAALKSQYKNVSAVAYTFRLQNQYWSVMQHLEFMKISDEVVIENVVDKAGSGDCFMAGLIYGLVNNLPHYDLINFATFAAVGKLYEKGDATKQTIEQIKQRYNDK